MIWFYFFGGWGGLNGDHPNGSSYSSEVSCTTRQRYSHSISHPFFLLFLVLVEQMNISKSDGWFFLLPGRSFEFFQGPRTFPPWALMVFHSNIKWTSRHQSKPDICSVIACSTSQYGWNSVSIIHLVLILLYCIVSWDWIQDLEVDMWVGGLPKVPNMSCQNSNILNDFRTLFREPR